MQWSVQTTHGREHLHTILSPAQGKLPMPTVAARQPVSVTYNLPNYSLVWCKKYYVLVVQSGYPGANLLWEFFGAAAGFARYLAKGFDRDTPELAPGKLGDFEFYPKWSKIPRVVLLRIRFSTGVCSWAMVDPVDEVRPSTSQSVRTWPMSLTCTGQGECGVQFSRDAPPAKCFLYFFVS